MFQRNGLLDAGQGEVGREFAFFFGEPDRLERGVDVAGQRRELVAAFDAGPENTGMAGIGEPA